MKPSDLPLWAVIAKDPRLQYNAQSVRQHPAPRFGTGDWCIQEGCLLTIAAVVRSAGPLLWVYCIRVIRADGSQSKREIYEPFALTDEAGRFAGLRRYPKVSDKRVSECC